jgi:hypothetical protein
MLGGGGLDDLLGGQAGALPAAAPAAGDAGAIMDLLGGGAPASAAAAAPGVRTGC